MAKAKTLFYCTNCGNEFPKWQGKCPACRSWNTITEHPNILEVSRKSSPTGRTQNGPRAMAQVETTEELRFATGMKELDRVLGGGQSQDRWFWLEGLQGLESPP